MARLIDDPVRICHVQASPGLSCAPSALIAPGPGASVPPICQAALSHVIRYRRKDSR